MGKYLKEFATHAEYESYINGGEAILPNVSICDDQPAHVHYKPSMGPSIRVIYNVTDTEADTQLTSGSYIPESAFTAMYVDGVKISGIRSSYKFDTGGEHIVDFELNPNETKIGYNWFNEYGLKFVGFQIPQQITTIDNSSISSGEESYYIILLSQTPPELGEYSFGGNISAIYVPPSAVDTYKNANVWVSYADIIGPYV